MEGRVASLELFEKIEERLEKKLEKKEDLIVDLKVKLQLRDKTISEQNERIKDDQQNYKILQEKYNQLSKEKQILQEKINNILVDKQNISNAMTMKREQSKSKSSRSEIEVLEIDGDDEKTTLSNRRSKASVDIKSEPGTNVKLTEEFCTLKSIKNEYHEICDKKAEGLMEYAALNNPLKLEETSMKIEKNTSDHVNKKMPEFYKRKAKI